MARRRRRRRLPAATPRNDARTCRAARAHPAGTRPCRPDRGAALRKQPVFFVRIRLFVGMLVQVPVAGDLVSFANHGFDGVRVSFGAPARNEEGLPDAVVPIGVEDSGHGHIRPVAQHRGPWKPCGAPAAGAARYRRLSASMSRVEAGGAAGSAPAREWDCGFKRSSWPELMRRGMGEGRGQGPEQGRCQGKGKGGGKARVRLFIARSSRHRDGPRGAGDEGCGVACQEATTGEMSAGMAEAHEAEWCRSPRRARHADCHEWQTRRAAMPCRLGPGHTALTRIALPGEFDGQRPAPGQHRALGRAVGAVGRGWPTRASSERDVHDAGTAAGAKRPATAPG